MYIPPSRLLDFAEIPIIDVRPLVAGDYNSLSIDAVRRACTEVGFFYVKNHGINFELLSRLHKLAGRFFDLSVGEKMKVVLEQQHMRGYLPFYRAYIDDASQTITSQQEGFWIGHDRPHDPERPCDAPNQWPEQLPALKPAMLEYFEVAENFSKTLQRAFALALNLEPEYFDTFFDRSMSQLKLNHYPPQEGHAREHDLGVGAHTDFGGFTVLWQDDKGGLEIQSKNGDWVGAPPIPGTFVVNIADMMQIWSNGLFSSTRHRVVNRSGTDRYSVAFFVNPNPETVIKPVVGDSNTASDIPPRCYGEYQLDLCRAIYNFG